MGTYLDVIITGLVLGTCFNSTFVVSKILWANLSDQIRFIIVGIVFRIGLVIVVGIVSRDGKPLVF